MGDGVIQQPEAPRLRVERVGMWTLVLLLSVQFLYFCVGAAVHPTHSFISYYTASRLAAEGADVSRFYEDTWFMEQVNRFQPGIIEIWSPNPPTTTLMLLPFAGLSYTNARVLWTLCSVLILIAASGWMVRVLRFNETWLPGLILLILLYHPLYTNIAVGQAYALLLGLLVVAWHGYRNKQDAVLGAALGVMLILKIAGIFLWLLLLVQRRWRALGWATLTTFAVTGITFSWLGPEAWQTHAQVLLDLRDHPKLSVAAYQSLHSFFHHLFVYDASWNAAPLLDASVVGRWLSRLGFFAVVGVCLYAAIRKPAKADLVFAAFVTANVILNPFTLNYHYTLLLLPLALLIRWACAKTLPWTWLGLGASIVLMANNLPHQSPRLAAGVVAFLAYPRLYGALLLWALTVWACLREKPASTAVSPQAMPEPSSHG